MPVVQKLSGYGAGKGVGRMPRRHAVADGDRRNFGQLVALGGTSLRFLRRLLHIGSRWNLAHGNSGKMLFHLCEDVIGLHVAHNREDRVVWSVILLVELLDVWDFGGVEILELTIEVVRIGIGVEGFSRKINREEKSIGTIHNVNPDFFFNYIALIFQILRGEVQSLHAIGFNPQHGIEG